jgi:phasin
MMDTPSKTATTKSGGSLRTDPAQAFRAMTGSDAKETLEKMSAAAAQAGTIMQDSCSTAVKGAQDYSSKFIEFARANTEATLEFVQRLSGVKSPTEFFELSADHSRKQFEILTEQTKELATLAQEVMLATAEPLKAGATKAFGKPS